jgi:predicted small secreted protein
LVQIAETDMKRTLAILALLATAAWSVSGCSSTAVYGGMIGAGVGGLSGDAASGMLIGAGIGGLVDAMK